MPRAEQKPRGAPLGARLCDRLLFGRQAGGPASLPPAGGARQRQWEQAVGRSADLEHFAGMSA
jgi:hypothetical protein